jgi:hypothetical protein
VPSLAHQVHGPVGDDFIEQFLARAVARKDPEVPLLAANHRNVRIRLDVSPKLLENGIHIPRAFDLQVGPVLGNG